MRHLLEGLLNRIFDQQKFAEAKNAAIATVSGTAGAALLTTYTIRSAQPSAGYSALNLAAAAIFFAALLVALASFAPRLQNRVPRPTGRDGPIPSTSPASTETPLRNLLFFEHIKDFTEPEYLTEIARALSITQAPTRIDKDLANQVIVQSQITSKKHKLFGVAATLMATGITAVFLILALEASSRVQHPNEKPASTIPAPKAISK